MPIAITVESGSGDPAANSYVDVTGYREYWAARGVTVGQTDDEVAAALIVGGDYLNNEQRWLYRGTRSSFAQGMSWPRTGATMYRGPAIPTDAIPPQLPKAQCEISARALAGTAIQPDLDRGGQVIEETIGPMTTRWAPGAAAETLYTAVAGWLAPLLMVAGVLGLTPQPYYAPPQDTTPFTPGEFDFPGQDTLTGNTDPSTSGT